MAAPGPAPARCGLRRLERADGAQGGNLARITRCERAGGTGELGEPGNRGTGETGAPGRRGQAGPMRCHGDRGGVYTWLSGQPDAPAPPDDCLAEVRNPADPHAGSVCAAASWLVRRVWRSGLPVLPVFSVFPVLLGPAPLGTMVKPRYKGRSTINPSRASTNPGSCGGRGPALTGPS